MDEHCGPICQSCHELHVTAKCPLDRNARHAWYPGDQTRMWERITSHVDIQERFQPTVLSQPKKKKNMGGGHNDDEEENGDGNGDGTDDGDTALEDPWIVVLENFINATEAQILIDHGTHIGYHRSAGVGVELPDGTFTDDIIHGRTSENAWCDTDECNTDPVTQAIMARMEFVTGIPTTNSEELQLLRYEPGQYCKCVSIARMRQRQQRWQEFDLCHSCFAHSLTRVLLLAWGM